MHLQFCCEGFVAVGGLFVLFGSFFVSCFLRGKGLVPFRAGFWFCSFCLVVQASVRFPNLPLVVGLWSAVSLRYAKGRVVVDPVSR